MSGARAAAVTRQPPRHPPQCLEDAFHDMGMEGDSVETESDPDHDLDPTDLLVALSQIGGTDFPEVLAAFMDKGQKPSVFTCFFCKDSGHTWLRCSKLWDHLKKPASRPGPDPNLLRGIKDLPLRVLGYHLVHSVPNRSQTRMVRCGRPHAGPFSWVHRGETGSPLSRGETGFLLSTCM